MSLDPESLKILTKHYNDADGFHRTATSSEAKKTGWNKLVLLSLPVLLAAASMLPKLSSGTTHKAATQLPHPTAPESSSPQIDIGLYMPITASEIPTSEEGYYSNVADLKNAVEDRASLDSAVNNARGKTDLESQRVQQYEIFRQSASQLDNDLGKLEAANEYVAAIKFDHGEWKTLSTMQDKKRNTDPSTVRLAGETVKAGKGVCADKAVLLSKALQQIGIDPDNIFLLTMGRIDKKTHRQTGHMAVVVKIGEKLMILDPTLQMQTKSGLTKGIMTTSDLYMNLVNEKMDKNGNEPKSLINMNGKVISLYGHEFKELALQDLTPPTVNISPEQVSAFLTVRGAANATAKLSDRIYRVQPPRPRTN